MPRRLPGDMVMVIMPVVVGMRMVVGVIVGMVVIVGVAVVVMVMSGCRDHGLEDFIGLLERYVVALEHLAYGKVVLDQQIIVGELSGKMQVADLPGPVGGFTGIGIGDLEYFFGKLLDDVPFFFVRKKHVTVGEGRGEVETEVNAILRLIAPTTLGQHTAFDLETYGGKIGGGFLRGKFLDYLHGQKRK